MSENGNRDRQDSLSTRFKVKASLAITVVIVFLISFLYYVSIQSCPSYWLTIIVRNHECDLSNIFGVIVSIIVAGIFAIILSWIFYEKQKIDTTRIKQLAEKELTLTTGLSKVNQRVSELEFEQRRLNASRILIRNFRDLSEINTIIRPAERKGIFRPMEYLNRRDEIVKNVREVIDATPLSHDPHFELTPVIEDLCSFAMRVPDRNTVITTGAVFGVAESPDYETLHTKINQMISTLDNFQKKVLERTESDLSF